MMTTWFDYPTDWSAFSFVPLYPGYDFQLRALNSSCGTQASAWEETQFFVNGQISGTVELDDAGATPFSSTIN